jgi:glycosyltransferase involved in cell wall biosynthesis
VKILLLNQAFYPDVASTSQHLTDLAVELVQRGHDVSVVCSRRGYNDPRERYLRREVWRGIRIRRISSFGFGKTARWRRAAGFTSYLANCMIHLAALPRYDVVMALTSPPLISWLGAVFARIKGGRFVFWVMDLNPDEAVAAGWLREGSWTSRWLQAMLRYSLRKAATVIVLDRFMADRIASKGIAVSNITVLAPWSHDHVVQYDADGRERFRREHGLAGKYVVMYSGNHSPCHPLTTLLEAAHRLREQRDVVFCFVGGGSEFEAVRGFALRRRLNNIVTIAYQKLGALAASLSAADLHIVVMGDPFVGLVHPCKVYNIRSLGIPYLYIGPTESHISDLMPVFTARHGDVDEVTRHIVDGARSARSVPTRTSGAELHSHQHLVNKMALVLEEAASRPPMVQMQLESPAASTDR